MKLSNEAIKALSVGAIHTEEKNGAVYFYKCTPKQMAAWFAQSDFLGGGARCATGVRLDFHTNSKTFTFATPEYGKYELWVDGVIRAPYAFREDSELKVGEPVSFALCDPLGEQKEEYRVTLHLPSHKEGALSLVEIDDGAYVRRHEFDRKMLMIGDSITQGWDSTYDSYSYAYHVSRFFNADSVIQGIGGAYYHESTFDSIPFDPDVITVAYGTNDWGHYATQDEMRSQVAAYMDLLKKEYPTKPIIIISPLWRAPKEKPMGSFADCRRVVISEAEKRGFVHIDGLSLVPPIDDLYLDGLHPNLKGFGIYGVNVCRELSKYIG